VRILDKKPFWDTSTTTMISCDRDENWEDREVESLGGYGNRKVLEVRKFKRFEML
jgi:hypothetical protein